MEKPASPGTDDVAKAQRVLDGSKRPESERDALVRERDRARRERRWTDADAIERDLVALDSRGADVIVLQPKVG